MSERARPGPVALVGSGEFLDVMVPVDAELLAGRRQRAVFLPTASAEEGRERVQYWIDLGTAHYAAMGVEPVPLEVLDREDAASSELASRVAGAGLVYLSGGNPGYLAHTLAGTAVWQAILDAWHAGAALAGCSAGACALSRIADDFTRPGRFGGEGLAVVPQLVVLPHFDRIERWAPGLVDRMLARTPEDAMLVGIDEETALVGTDGSFAVLGNKSVWRLDGDGTRLRVEAGEHLEMPSSAPQ
ncbi:MAG TPA: Type 1 glutamine amidotransferase-like domain-containing protein [Acidimicrobiales bacterium]|nr:Type 1 glutamine amidotransferase-like domain-containing protein [Acidimicrobiales bacterium]